VKIHSSSNLDFNNYNNQVIKLKSKQYPSYIIAISLLIFISIIAFVFLSITKNSDVKDNIVEHSDSSVKHEMLSLPPLQTKPTDSITYVEQQTKLQTINSTNKKTQPQTNNITFIEPQAELQTDLIKTQETKQTVTSLKEDIAITTSPTLTTMAIEPEEKISYTIKSGDNLAIIFKKHNLTKQTLHKVVHTSKHGKQLARIKPGQNIVFTFKNIKDKNQKQLTSVALQKTKLETLKIVPSSENPDQFISNLETKKAEVRQRFVNVTIQDSLFLSATKAGLSDSFTMELAQLFGWDIDFALDIRNGDSFSVLYNELYLDGEKISNGQILVAEFTNQGKLHESIYYTDESGKSDYYSSDGYSKRKAFIRTPVAFSRISSRFSNGRRHPVLNKIRAHRGVDYAAPRGTPIKSAGDGKVSFKGRKGGYGRVIQINHGSKYMTVYAHLKSFSKKIRRGSRVKQGQIIGYVGSSGLATGPHLHYEFRVNGVHRNPLTVKLPKANPINKKYRQNFIEHSENMLSSLKLKKHEHIALLKQ